MNNQDIIELDSDSDSDSDSTTDSPKRDKNKERSKNTKRMKSTERKKSNRGIQDVSKLDNAPLPSSSSDTSDSDGTTFETNE